MENTTEIRITRDSLNCCVKMRQALKSGHIIETPARVTGDFESTIIRIPQLILGTKQRKEDPWQPENPPVELYNCPFCGKRICQKLNIEEITEEKDAE